jgi:uncharacterized protein YfcZ (UPF0381/DUF406 family)
MKLVVAIILSVLFVLLGVQIYKFWGEANMAMKEYSALEEKVNAAKEDNAKFQAELDYYKNPVNLEKELRARFNYKVPGEKMIIIVPRNQSGTASSTP